MPRYTLKDGVFVPIDNHSPVVTENRLAEMLQKRQAPGYSIKVGEWKRDAKLRKFDKPSEDEIKKLEKEDLEETKKATDIMPVITQSKLDLQSGRIKIDPAVLHNLNGKKYDKIVPFGAVEDDRGITHIVPKNKLPTPVLEEKETIEQYYEKMKSSTQVEQAKVSVGRTESGNLSAPPQSAFEQKAIQAINTKGRDFYRGQTIP